jgi:hypothetical protein
MSLLLSRKNQTLVVQLIDIVGVNVDWTEDG